MNIIVVRAEEHENAAIIIDDNEGITVVYEDKAREIFDNYDSEVVYVARHDTWVVLADMNGIARRGVIKAGVE